MSKRFLFWVSIFFTQFILASNASAASLVINGGSFNGIDGVDVSGTLYDVSFHTYDQSVPHVYDSNFAQAASLSLYHLFTNGQFQGAQPDVSNTLKVAGVDISSASLTRFATAYGMSYNSIVSEFLVNFYGGNDYVDGFGFGYFTPSYTNIFYGDWTKSVSAVPVPSALILFAPALLGLLGLRRKVIPSA